MKYVVDRIEGDVVVLENLETKNMITKELSCFPFLIAEGNVLEYSDENHSFILLKEEEEKRRIRIREKLNRLKNLKK